MPARKKFRKKTYLFLLIFLLIATGIFVLYNQSVQIPWPNEDLNSKSTFEQSIEKAKNISANIFEGTRIIKNVAPFDNCNEGKYCIQYTNDNISWFAASEPGFKVKLTGYYAVKMTLRGEKYFAGINLIGKYAEKGKEWWDGRKSLNIFVLYDNIELYVDTGFARDPIQITSEKVTTDENGNLELIFIFDKNGKNLIITNTQGLVINIIDINQSASGNLPDGIFPAEEVYVGISLTPQAKLTIVEFFGFPLIGI